MTPEMVATLWGVGGVVLGAIITVMASYFQQRWLNNHRDKERRQSLQYEVARDLMRNRLDQRNILMSLNEIPLLFGDDDEAMRLYRAVLQPNDEVSRTHNLAALIQHIAKCAGLSAKVTSADVVTGFTYRDDAPES